MNSVDDTQYWNEYYDSAKNAKVSAPSQFAAFVASDVYEKELLIDIGCGNGRDTFFFANYFSKVVGIDSSAGAINFCQKLADDRDADSLTFHRSAVGSAEFSKLLQTVRRENSSSKAVIYSRFFIHALSEDDESSFIKDVAEALMPGDILALEYRTVRDSSGAKVTAEHYRRFVSPYSVCAKLDGLEFDLSYAVEGFGMAKYKADDAYVARSFHVKR